MPDGGSVAAPLPALAAVVVVGPDSHEDIVDAHPAVGRSQLPGVLLGKRGAVIGLIVPGLALVLGVVVDHGQDIVDAVQTITGGVEVVPWVGGVAPSALAFVRTHLSRVRAPVSGEVRGREASPGNGRG